MIQAFVKKNPYFDMFNDVRFLLFLISILLSLTIRFSTSLFALICFWLNSFRVYLFIYMLLYLSIYVILTRRGALHQEIQTISCIFVPV